MEPLLLTDTDAGVHCASRPVRKQIESEDEIILIGITSIMIILYTVELTVTPEGADVVSVFLGINLQ